ncbi:MAG: NAD-dependent epimerase/dehydratase family protein [Anaerolineae bacterium]|nr:NAD-dependent epimerase/dehydratase family protein [Anaerolineae bacterium]
MVSEPQTSHHFLVTGGAGFLGINLIRYLLQRGHSVTSLDIAEFKYPDVADQVAIIQGDIRDMATVQRAMEGCDIVVHGAAALPLYSREDIWSTNVDGTRNVLEAALQKGIGRVIYISSTAVYGIPDHHPLLEDDKMDGVGPYGETKVVAEGICAEYRARGLVIPTLRPKSFVGPERLGVFSLLYEWAAEGKHFPMLGRGDNPYQLLDVEDLCAAIDLAANAEASAANTCFNIGAKVFTTMRQEFQAVLDEAGFGRRIIPFPAGPMTAALTVLEWLHLSPLYKWTYKTAAKDSFVSVERAERVLGFTPRYSNTDALLRNYRWYLANRAALQGSGITHRVAWNQGLLRLAKLFF